MFLTPEALVFKNCSNSKKQGDIGLASAISWFCASGYTVSVPLTDSQDYDLIVDNGTMYRVQVKTTTNCRNGKYEVGLRVLGGNRSWSGVAKKFDNKKVDILFILTESGDRYVIPTEKIESTNSITVGVKWLEYKV